MDFQQNTQPEVQNEQQSGNSPASEQMSDNRPAPNAQPSGNPSNNNRNGNNAMGPNPYSHNPYNQNPYNQNPYYNRNAYRMPAVEPGSSLYTAAFILGIIAIFCCFTFTVYPAFILGSIAIILALLSKGRNAKMNSKASVGIICATAALVLNTLIVTYSMTMVFTDPETRQQLNETCEEMYGVSFDEMLEEITGNSDTSN
ncbi:MAG: hypothetical protein PUD93_01535 [Lachnospiraceae bacterium]|nr:hypothetical protein [Lachnospiraceae bacterium]